MKILVREHQFDDYPTSITVENYQELFEDVLVHYLIGRSSMMPARQYQLDGLQWYGVEQAYKKLKEFGSVSETASRRKLKEAYDKDSSRNKSRDLGRWLLNREKDRRPYYERLEKISERIGNVIK